MHQHDSRFSGGEPSNELVLVCDVGDEEAAVAFVFAVVTDAATLCWESADHVEAGFTGADELVPEKGAPAALEVVLVYMRGRGGGG